MRGRKERGSVNEEDVDEAKKENAIMKIRRWKKSEEKDAKEHDRERQTN